jgi:transcriptional regulator with XRE-family HTH domain
MIASVSEYAEAVGQAIRNLRQGQGLSQEELAHRAGVHRTYIGGIERGERNPTVESLKKIADGLGLDPAAILLEASRPRRLGR